jgi:hypothetical protein
MEVSCRHTRLHGSTAHNTFTATVADPAIFRGQADGACEGATRRRLESSICAGVSGTAVPSMTSMMPAVVPASLPTAASRQAATRRPVRGPLPLPAFTDRRTRRTVYALPAIDCNGRLADQAIVRVMGWKPGRKPYLTTHRQSRGPRYRQTAPTSEPGHVTGGRAVCSLSPAVATLRACRRPQTTNQTPTPITIGPNVHPIAISNTVIGLPCASCTNISGVGSWLGIHGPGLNMANTAGMKNPTAINDQPSSRRQPVQPNRVRHPVATRRSSQRPPAASTTAVQRRCGSRRSKIKSRRPMEHRGCQQARHRL